MPKINILNILSGDNQSTIVDKINYNFDQILSSGGGPQGQQGIIGSTGPVGPQGVPGIQGTKGDKGNKWFVAQNPPSNGSLGDFWLDVDSSDQSILEYQSTGWVNTGYGLSSGDIFQKMNYIRGGGSTTSDKTAVVLGGLGSGLGSTANTSFVLSDIPITTVGSISGYSPGQGTETYIRNVNQENSKLKITTDNRTNLISFSRGSLDVVNPTLNGLNNPTISWLSPSTASNPYDIAFKNPTGSISILTEGTLRGPIEIKSNSDSVYITSLGVNPLGGVNILAIQEVTAKSNGDNISLLTAASTKGTFIRFNPVDGFSEFNNDVNNIINSNTPALFINSNGVGIGVGKNVNYTFKQSGADPRKLAVLGNVSIGKSGVDHETTNMFIGINAQSDYDKGSLFVRGHGAFGHNDPRTDETSGLTTIGPSETGNSFPRLFVTASRNGQVFQVKNVVGIGTKAAVSRTTIGDGLFDYNAVTDKTSAGYGPDLTQEFFVGGYVFTAAPLISLQHKITNSSNTSDTSTVFSISTFTNSGLYDPVTIADKTLIQTRNSNSNLSLFANATSSSRKNNNRVIIGARNNSLIAVFAGTDTEPTRGSVTIGRNAETNVGVVGPLDPSLITFATYENNNHSLNVVGVQTIGTVNPYSAFSTGSFINYPINSSRPVGNVSMLKIQRNFSNYTTSNFATGYIYNNNSNGLEIITYKSSIPNPDPTANKSVGIAVAASKNTKETPTTGFFVSDDGNNASIGSFINYSVALNVVGTVNATTSVTTPTVTTTTITATNINITGGGNIAGGGSIPLGGIIMWSGSIVPVGWALCNGQTVSGQTTPNLIDRFIIATNTAGVNTYGGSQNADTAITIQSGNLPKHTHGKGTLAISSSGGHVHTIHKSYNTRDGSGYPSSGFSGEDTENWGFGGGQHTHSSSDFTGSTDDGGFANSPLPIFNYYKLAFIMRVS